MAGDNSAIVKKARIDQLEVIAKIYSPGGNSGGGAKKEPSCKFSGRTYYH
jgi:hypothetical protein